MWNHKRAGFSMIEMIVVISVASIVLVSLTEVVELSLRLTHRATQKTAAVYLLREGGEVLRHLRDDSWSTHIAPLTTGTTYYLSWSGSGYIISATPVAPIDGFFHREIVFASVSRNNEDDIVVSGGTDDPGTRRVTIQVAWVTGGVTSTEALVFYLSDIFEN